MKRTTSLNKFVSEICWWFVFDRLWWPPTIAAFVHSFFSTIPHTLYLRDRSTRNENEIVAENMTAEHNTEIACQAKQTIILIKYSKVIYPY